MGYNLLLTVGAALLLGTLLVSTQVLITYSETDSVENEYVLAAHGIAQSLIDEAKTRAFDEATVAADVADSTGFTPPGSLGYDAGETVPTADTSVTSSPFSPSNPGYPGSVLFDDVDDYHGYQRVMRYSRAAEGDTVRCTVEYASLDNPGQPAGGRTYCKLMTVTVTGRYLRFPVSLTYGFTY